MKKNLFILIAMPLFLLSVGCSKPADNSVVNTNASVDGSAVSFPSTTPTSQSTPMPTQEVAVKSGLSEPMSRSVSRVVLKPFGLKVSPGNSPVDPERFSGYHAAADYEISVDEADVDVEVKAICEGKILSKRTVNGYGGLVTQSCTINNQDVTILYGHVRLSSVTTAVGTLLKAGEKLAVLGKGYSAETSNERKHLHLGIVKGKNSSEIRGYVQTQAELSKFINPLTLY